MRNPARKFAYGLAALALAAVLLWLAFGEVVGPEDSQATMIAGFAGLLLLMGGGYFAVAGAGSAAGSARLLRGEGVIARWDVPRATWEAFRAIELEQTGVSLPGLDDLYFTPRGTAPAGPVPIICGEKGALIDGCYFALAPGRGAGMEQAGMVLTRPACLALVIAMPGGAGQIMRRFLLLLPVPVGAEAEAQTALRHYLRAIDSVRDLGDLAEASPRAARRIFGIALTASVSAAAVGIGLETIDYPGLWPDVVALTGIMGTLALLLLGWLLLPRRKL